MPHLNRRQFLTLSAGAAGTVLLPRCAGNQAATLASPNVITSQAGLLNVSLMARQDRYRIGGQQGQVMSYNGQIPGTRLEARPGDTVEIRFENQLPQATNLHYHGLHIPSTGNADNIFLSIPSNETLDYEFIIPNNHPAGTFYYHPHLHGTVAEQIFAGLGGIFVVRGSLDEIPEIQAAQEEFLFLKDFSLDANGQIPNPGHMELMQGREGATLTVNGQINPSFSVPTGGLLRLRIVNASAARFYRLSLEDHPLYLIATDGGAITEPVELQELLLSPGERAEVLVKGDREPKQYRLLNLPYNRGGMGMMGEIGNMGSMGMMHSMNGMGRMGNASVTQSPQLLATLVYQDEVSPIPLPKQLIPVEALPEPTNTRRIELSMAMGTSGMGAGMSMGSSMGMQFLFNGKTFDMNRVDAAVKLGTVEEWELVNSDPDRMDHPFHLHVNSFQIISRNGQPDPYPAWKDTLIVRGNETVRIRIPFQDFAGRTVYHCHILDHEDLGMMGLVEIS